MYVPFSQINHYCILVFLKIFSTLLISGLIQTLMSDDQDINIAQENINTQNNNSVIPDISIEC